ncbi:MAG: hypothetical protein IIA88_06580 [Bacteroidetes bacterium]|nr:hypothetical protein [Bacteroidota bacterium]
MKIPKIKRPSEEILNKIQSLEGMKGMLVAIEPDSEDWFIGETAIEAMKKAKEKYPDNIFYLVRVGYPAAHWHKGGFKRVKI